MTVEACTSVSGDFRLSWRLGGRRVGAVAGFAWNPRRRRLERVCRRGFLARPGRADLRLGQGKDTKQCRRPAEKEFETIRHNYEWEVEECGSV